MIKYFQKKFNKLYFFYIIQFEFIIIVKLNLCKTTYLS